MNLIQALPEGPLDIVGDIHGEYEALCNLLRHLGYDEQGQHPDGRTLVFVGDFCDRGPDSPAVLALVENLIRTGRAVAVLGNHEINLLREDAKDGSGWFFEERKERDQARYAPLNYADETARSKIVAFLSTLPIALERADLRVIHAAWISDKLDQIRDLPLGSVRQHYDAWEKVAQQCARELEPRMAEERLRWEHGLENIQHEPPFMHALADNEAIKQMMNPLKVLTSGVERKGEAAFYSSGKWRFTERVQWWDEYTDGIPVVVGHYWRRFDSSDANANKGGPDLFDGVLPQAWHGVAGNVFCVDFSVGARWSARKACEPVAARFKLAALQWPERMLRFDDGHFIATVGFMS
ncbi:metallophosphoesterase [Herbaspirillum sp. RTI4]|uniref:metallophosphoesterase n=1 Tax=Herbaspirillum sp. RTI4 TaxID=3048640 RepID=UPI002AB503D3|nr:metallophosphoesterase [Herbaspirillum sp. RTI4]MDY7580090.1 metallophosphoesterase [Herbaspirillum sp. RTI4]MEA9983129.1 metallophosphoesterase [Herbaspirillum sp. RTI4]